jgi:Ca2+-transporting ATPase
MTGSGRAVICAVGKNTRLSRESTDETLVIEGQQTYLEDRLYTLERQISKYATVATMLIVALQILHLTIRLLIMRKSLFDSESLMKAVHISIVGICIYIVAIPEGLALAISIAMALSTNKLKKHEILIKNLEAV